MHQAFSRCFGDKILHNILKYIYIVIIFPLHLCAPLKLIFKLETILYEKLLLSNSTSLISITKISNESFMSKIHFKLAADLMTV